MRILLVSQMYPGPGDPDLGVFVQALEEELAAPRARAGARGPRQPKRGEGALFASRPGRGERGPQLPAGRRLRALPRPDRAAGRARLPRATRRDRSRAGRPEHRRLPRDPRRHALRRPPRRSCRRRLRTTFATSSRRRCPEARGKVEVVDCGVDLERFRVEPAPEGQTAYLCVGSLIERQERGAPGGRLRAARLGHADVRRRRAAARRRRDPPRRDRHRARRSRRDPESGSRAHTSSASRA